MVVFGRVRIQWRRLQLLLRLQTFMNRSINTRIDATVRLQACAEQATVPAELS